MMIKNKHNPIIRPESVSASHPRYRVRGCFNPGAIRHKDEIILLLRVAEDCLPKEGYISVPFYSFTADIPSSDCLEVRLDDPDVTLKDTRGVVYKGVDYLSTMSHIRLARSKDGVHFSVEDQPFIAPIDESETFGVEDARVTEIDGLYYINYTSVSKDGYGTSLAVTTDFRSYEKKGMIFNPQNKDVSIFPEKIGGKYFCLHRPNNSGFGLPSIWLADSPDLIHWGNHRCILRPRHMFWEEQKIGGGAAPIKTSEGWLEIYHGKGRDQIYSLFCLLLDLEEPWRVIKRGEMPIIKPDKDYEIEGFFPNIVFTNGMVTFEDGRVFLYYGACDETVCLAETTVRDLLSSF